MSLLSQHHHPSDPDVLASPLAGGFICQQYTGATCSSCLFSPLADVSTSSGMHSSCPSFAQVTNVWLAVSKIRSLSFFILSLRPPLSIFSLSTERNQTKAEGRQELAASSSDLVGLLIIIALLNW